MQLVREHVRPACGSSFLCLDLDRAEFDSHYHHHPEIEITWIVESDGERLIGDTIAEFGEGDLVLIGSGVPHRYRNWQAGRARAKVIQFPCELFGSGFLAQPECERMSQLLAEAARGLRFSTEIEAEARERISRIFELTPGVPRLIELLGLLHALSGDPGRRAIASIVYAKPVDLSRIERLQRVLNFIEARWQQPISLHDAARAASLHPQSLSRFFRQHLGVTFQEYLIRLRLSRAARLLLESDRTVADVAFACGFNNMANFNRHFQAAYSRTPRSYRRGVIPP
jgi:AraC-like DNA-binding protein